MIRAVVAEWPEQPHGHRILGHLLEKAGDHRCFLSLSAPLPSLLSHRCVCSGRRGWLVLHLPSQFRSQNADAWRVVQGGPGGLAGVASGDSTVNMPAPTCDVEAP